MIKIKENELNELYDKNLFFIIGSGTTSMFIEKIDVKTLEKDKDKYFSGMNIDLQKQDTKEKFSINDNDANNKYKLFLFNKLIDILQNSNGIGRLGLVELNILTPNYDNFIENTIRMFDVNVKLNKYNSERRFDVFNKIEIDKINNFATPSINLFKPHGDIETPEKTHNKGFWIKEVESNSVSEFNSFEEIRIFRNNLLDKNNSILFVIGYGYNDKYINQIILDSLNNKNNKNILNWWNKDNKIPNFLNEIESSHQNSFWNKKLNKEETFFNNLFNTEYKEGKKQK